MGQKHCIRQRKSAPFRFAGSRLYLSGPALKWSVELEAELEAVRVRLRAVAGRLAASHHELTAVLGEGILSV